MAFEYRSQFANQCLKKEEMQQTLLFKRTKLISETTLEAVLSVLIEKFSNLTFSFLRCFIPITFVVQFSLL